jgi:hypothetical protein
MGGEQAAGVLAQVKRDGLEKKGQQVNTNLAQYIINTNKSFSGLLKKKPNSSVLFKIFTKRKVTHTLPQLVYGMMVLFVLKTPVRY